MKLYQFRVFKTTAQESYKSLEDSIEDLCVDKKVHQFLEIQLLEPSDTQLPTQSKQEAEETNQDVVGVCPLISVSESSKKNHTSKKRKRRDPQPPTKLKPNAGEEAEVSQLESSEKKPTPKKKKKRDDPFSLKGGVSKSIKTEGSEQTRKEYATKASLRVEPRSIFAGHECQVCAKIFVTKKCLSRHVAEHTETTS
jgi:hypothetical protein